MRYVFAVLAVMMTLAAAVQYNDPDGPLWMAYYGVPAIWCWIAALRPNVLGAMPARVLLGASFVAAVALTALYWPTSGGWWHEEVWRMGDTAVQGPIVAEAAREGMGMMIATVVVFLVALASFGARRGSAAALR